MTLSTFRDVPWNAPFYSKNGFRALSPSEWTPTMRAIREKEAQHGLRVEARVFMRRELERHPLGAACRYAWRGRLAASMRSSRSIGMV